MQTDKGIGRVGNLNAGESSYRISPPYKSGKMR
jgi:hypothetical protein